MRLFTGLSLPANAVDALGALLERLRAASPGQNWSPPANLHITLKFIGEFPESQLGELKAALGGLAGVAPRISLRGFGWAPNPHRPRALFVPVRASDALGDLAARTSAAVELLGVPREQREYQPHVTLARIKSPDSLAPARQVLAGWPAADFGDFAPAAFHLYRSVTGPRGSTYTILESFPFVP
jgi:2'-5' RNA ligase